MILVVSSIAERFRVALEDVREPGLAVPELLPVQLSRACARIRRNDDTPTIGTSTPARSR